MEETLIFVKVRLLSGDGGMSELSGSAIESPRGFYTIQFNPFIID
jgi:hypothetical protein